jgi:hypothetical protein
MSAAMMRAGRTLHLLRHQRRCNRGDIRNGHGTTPRRELSPPSPSWPPASPSWRAAAFFVLHSGAIFPGVSAAFPNFAFPTTR